MPTKSRKPSPPPASSRPGPPPADSALPDPGAARWPILALLAVATVAVFAGVLRNGWIMFDDPRYVFANLHVKHGLRLQDALWFLTHAHCENWHPLTSWSHMLDMTLFGLQPAGHHAMNLALHTLNAVLLALVLHRLTGAWWRSLLVAALFALHPLRVESVAWISERKDVLSGVFFLLTIEAYRRWVVRPRRGRYAVLMVALAMGLMAKPMLVTLPVLLVLLDVWPLGRLKGLPATPAAPPGEAVRAPARPLAGLVAEKWPLFALAAVSAVVTFFVQRKAGAVVAVDVIPIAGRTGNALISFWRYVGKEVWPTHLAVFYPYPRRMDLLPVALSVAGLAVTTMLAFAQARRRPWLVVGWLWYLGMLVPVIGLVQVGGQAYADRYSYLPGIGLVIPLVWALGEVAARSHVLRNAIVSASVVVVAALSMLTLRQVPLWRDTATLFNHALTVTPRNPIADEALGEALLRAGRLGPALAHLESALGMMPNFAAAHTNLGSVLGMLGRNDEAIAHFRASLRLHDDPEAHHNLGFTLAKQGRVDEAIPEFEAALRMDPELPLTLGMLGRALASRGRLAEAEDCLRRATDLDPADLESRRALAAVRVQMGRVEEAIVDYGEILRRSPDDLDALNNVAWIRATHADPRHRDGAAAVRMAERARDRSPQPSAVIFSTLAAAYAEAGRLPEAVSACERAIELARGAHATEEAGRYEDQLRCYRAGKPFHFAK